MTDSSRLLLVDDDTTALGIMSDLLIGRGYNVDTASSVDEAEENLQSSAYRVVISDFKMPRRTGLDLLKLCVDNYPETAVIIITGHGTIRNAVDALKQGAFEYLSKPVQMDELILVIQKAIGHRRLVDQNIFLRNELDRIKGFYYKSANPTVQQIYSTIEVICKEDTSVLIQGESGTGKEVIARLLHNTSRRSQASFVPINCGAIPENLIESELFGYEKGAFTGAEQRTQGKLELADGGTLFLDEVNELPPRAQVALLRFIQEGEISPLGSTRRISVNVRLITATNADLADLVRKGSFREDLYYRINVLPLKLPPLRERREDILPLASWFLTHFRASTERAARSFSPDAEQKLIDYHWPGNIRELRNCIDRATIFCRTPVIGTDSLLLTPVRDVSHYNESSAPGCCFDEFGVRPLKELENEYIEWVIDQHGGNRTRAAEALGISVRGLRYKLNSNE